MASKLGDRLKSLRDKKKLSNASLAKAASIDESTLGQILSGDISRPPDKRLTGLAKLLGVSMKSLKDLIPSAVREAAIPEDGIIGAERLTEAAAGAFRTITNLLREALLALIMPNDPHSFVDISAVYPDRVIVADNARQFSYPYTITDANQVELGSPTEVVTEHIAVREAMSEVGAFIEAIDADEASHNRWLIKVIEAGVSGNRNYYTDTFLRESAPLFNNARVFVKSDELHLKGKGKDFNLLIGRLTESKFVPGTGKDSGRITAVFDVLESAGDIAEKIYEAYSRDMGDLFGFSVDADAVIKQRTINRQRVREAKKITKVHSVDLIIEPGAGGEIIQLLEAQQLNNSDEDNDMKLLERLLEALKIKNPTLAAEIDLADEDAALATITEALVAPADAGSAVAGDDDEVAANNGNGVSKDELAQALRLVEARTEGRALIDGSNLPAATIDKLHAGFAGRDDYTIEQVREAVKGERDYLAKITESGSISGLGDDYSLASGEDRADKVAKMFDGLFDPANRDVISIKECYIEVTGDKRVTGQLRDCDTRRLREAAPEHLRLTEAISAATFNDILGDSITRRMVADYNAPSRYDIWRHLTGVPVPLSDFRTQERVRMGGYGDLPAVAENGPYAALASPTDEKATYAASKRGGTETISLETIKNDDMGVILRVPNRLSRAAQRTLAKFVLDFLKANAAIYDTVALFHATHANLGVAALDATSIAAGRLQMLKQTELNSADRLGLAPSHLWVPADLEEAAFDLFRRTTNNDTDFVETLQMEIHPVWYWTDANNWYQSADTNDVPVIEIGFLDGREEPELFVQDSPTQGSLFSNDQIVYKIRHIYSGAVVDFRGLQGNVVA